MGRKRAPEADYICAVCGCACNPSGDKHIGGGDAAHTSCGKPPVAVLRSKWDADLKIQATAATQAIRDRLSTKEI